MIEAIAAATGLPLNPELEEWMALMAGAQQGLAMARGTEASGAVGRQGEEQALESLLHRAAGADPEERPALKAALAALANGDTLLAEASFEQEVEASRRLRLAAVLNRWARCRPLPQGVRYQCLGGPPTAVGDPAG